jgi:DNA-directed RNA polymerase specialized sigma24 family protein
VLRALVVHELERDEVCEHLGIDRAYLRVLLHRARKAFRTLSEDLDHRRHRAVTSVQS